MEGFVATDDLQAAIERVREYRRLVLAGEHWADATVAVYGSAESSYRVHSPAADDAAVLDAYLADHPEDDTVVADGDWLRAEGWSEMPGKHGWYPPVKWDGPNISWLPPAWPYDHGTLRFGGYDRLTIYHMIDNPTRGDIRRVLVVLGTRSFK